jgi:cytochrome c5
MSTMRARILVSSVLFLLGLTLPALARALVEAPPPPEVQEVPPEPGETPQKPVTPAEPPRGQLLYENHCTSCHESVVHVRDNHRTQSLAGLRERVANWADYLHLHWDSEEAEDVVQHLNTHYYKFEAR